MSSDLSFSPFRSIDDFFLSKARFQKPSFKELDKWNKRVVANLLYYQTNYFVMSALIFIIFSIISPHKMLLGIIVLGVGILACIYSSKSLTIDSKRHQKQSYQPYSSLAIIIAGGYLLLYHYMAIALLLLCLLLSVFLTLIHSSMRLRNLKNKISNKMEMAGIKKTPMGLILNIINVQSEDFLN